MVSSKIPEVVSLASNKIQEDDWAIIVAITGQNGLTVYSQKIITGDAVPHVRR